MRRGATGELGSGGGVVGAAGGVVAGSGGVPPAGRRSRAAAGWSARRAGWCSAPAAASGLRRAAWSSGRVACRPTARIPRPEEWSCRREASELPCGSGGCTGAGGGVVGAGGGVVVGSGGGAPPPEGVVVGSGGGVVGEAGGVVLGSGGGAPPPEGVVVGSGGGVVGEAGGVVLGSGGGPPPPRGWSWDPVAASSARAVGVVLGSGGEVLGSGGLVEVSTELSVPATMCVAGADEVDGASKTIWIRSSCPPPWVKPSRLDRPGRHDLRRPERGVERGELVGEVARVDVRLRHALAVDREDVERVSARSVAHLERADPELVLLRQVVEHRHEPRVGAAPRQSRMRLRREGQVRVVEQGRDLRRAREVLATSPIRRG